MFHSANPTLFGRPDSVLGEVEGVRHALDRLRNVSHELSLNAAQATIDARRWLAVLSTSLSAYFDVGQADAYFAAIVGECPDLTGRVRSLSVARERLQFSVTSVRRLAFCTGDTAELGRRIDGVVASFTAHERSECDLLQSFFLGGETLANRPSVS